MSANASTSGAANNGWASGTLTDALNKLDRSVNSLVGRYTQLTEEKQILTAQVATLQANLTAINNLKAEHARVSQGLETTQVTLSATKERLKRVRQSQEFYLGHLIEIAGRLGMAAVEWGDAAEAVSGNSIFNLDNRDFDAAVIAADASVAAFAGKVAGKLLSVKVGIERQLTIINTATKVVGRGRGASPSRGRGRGRGRNPSPSPSPSPIRGRSPSRNRNSNRNSNRIRSRSPLPRDRGRDRRK